MKVLVVDDSQMTRMIVKKTLASFDVKDVVEAEDGQQALTAFGQGDFDVVFSDWNMPNMSGLELAIEIRKVNTDVPIIMITTEGSKDKVVAAIQQGVNDYLVKPFTPAALREKLAKWVGATA
ncbi:MAG: two-component system response regulator [Planctomycetaceae bacterium]|nr:two-component system response regulator [Planctomycetaceae bacterium]